MYTCCYTCHDLLLLGDFSYLAQNFGCATGAVLGVSLNQKVHQGADIQPGLLCLCALQSMNILTMYLVSIKDWATYRSASRTGQCSALQGRVPLQLSPKTVADGAFVPVSILPAPFHTDLEAF